MFDNCRLYNQAETVYYKCANELEEYIRPQLEALKDGTLEINLGESKRTLGKSKKKGIEKRNKWYYLSLLIIYFIDRINC